MINYQSLTVLSCREDRIRTCDPLVPNQVRYRPALLPERYVFYNRAAKVSVYALSPNLKCN